MNIIIRRKLEMAARVRDFARAQLDALNRFRFRNDAEALGAWRSARNVAWLTIAGPCVVPLP